MNLHQLVTENNVNTIELDEKFFIKNIDTGEIYHFQNDDSYQKIFEKINPNMVKPQIKTLNPEKIWQDYWKGIRKTREKLWNACETGDLAGLVNIIDLIKNSHTPIDINDKTLNNYTGLHLACEHGHDKIMETLLAQNANIEALTTFGRTPLHLACFRGNVSTVKGLLVAGAKVDVCDEEQNTPLHMAAENNHVEIVEELLKKQPRLDIRNYQGMTAFDLCLDIKTRKLFENYGVESDLDLKSSYSRIDLGDKILNNGRKDHVEKLLYLGQKNKVLVSTEMINNEIQVKKTHSDNFSSPLREIEETKEEDVGGPEGPKIKLFKDITKPTAFSEQNLTKLADNVISKVAAHQPENLAIKNKAEATFEPKIPQNPINNITSSNNTTTSNNTNNNPNIPSNKTNDSTKKSSLRTFLNFFNTSSSSSNSNNSEKDKPAIQMKPKMSLNDFYFYKLLGKGSFGEVFLVKEKNPPSAGAGKFYAMKVLNKDKVFSQNLIKYAKSERNILSIMNHPFIVRLNYAFQNQNKLFLILDYCPGGDLGKMLTKKRRLPEEIVRIYVSEIVLGIEALHSKNIIFRDLKPDNVVMDKDGHALLTDFGLSRQGVDQNFAKSFCGSVAYLAPEMLAKAGHNKTIDWYLVGVLFYELLVGIPPFFSKNREEMFNNIKSGPLLIPKNLSPEAKDLMKRLLCRNPKNRLGSQFGAVEVKSHPFFNGLNWDDVYNKKLVPPEIENKEIIDQPDELLYIQCLGTVEEDRKMQEMNYIEGWSYDERGLI